MRSNDKSYSVDCGAERLIWEWKLQRQRWTQLRNGLGWGELDQSDRDILHEAGAANFDPSEYSDYA